MSREKSWIEQNGADLAAWMEFIRARLISLGRQCADSKTKSKVAKPAVKRPAQPPANADYAVTQLGDRLGLSAFESSVLLLCAAVELDTTFPSLLQQVDGRPYPTFALALALFDDPDWRALSPHRPLRRALLIDAQTAAGSSLIQTPLRVDERIVHFLKGLNELDSRLRSCLVPWEQESAATTLPPSQADAVEDLLSELRLNVAASTRLAPVVQLLGCDRESKQLVAHRLAERFELHPLRLPVSFLPREPRDQEQFAQLWERESRLLPIALYVDAADAAPEQVALLTQLLPRLDGLVCLDTIEPVAITGRHSVSLDVEPPTAVEQRDLWCAHLGEVDSELPALLSTQFRLDAGSIATIARRPTADVDPAARRRQLWHACRRRVRPRLDLLAQRIDAKATFDDLVLPAEQSTLLREITAHIRHRGRVYGDWGFDRRLNRGLGVSVLFAGESGTGKTMAAEVLARDLDLDLYRIDLSRVVNKYIGETEKNLRRVFDAAEAGGVILFFDEADALFGKRTEVKDSHDRFANIEINYLLQRMEAFRGLAILATNLKQTLDSAFLRRLRFVVDFPVPDRTQRQEIWRRAFPSETPLAGLDYGRLAQLPLTGGNIHSIAVNAAFASAGDADAVDMPHLLRAAQTECRKLNKPTSASDFRWERNHV